MSIIKVKSKDCIVAVFEDDVVLLDAIKVSNDKGYKILDSYTPFPVHGIEPLLGIKRSNLAVAAFMFGFFGFCAGLSLVTYTMHLDWPTVFGGKPTWALTSFIPVTFELTILFAALGMTFTYYWISGLLPGVQPIIYDKRATDDRFLVLFEADDRAEEIRETMKQNGSVELRDDIHYTHNFPGPLPIILKSKYQMENE